MSVFVFLPNSYRRAPLMPPPLFFQAEHDTEARPILVTPSAALVEAVNACLRKRLWALPTRDTALAAVKKGFAVICKASNLTEDTSPTIFSLFIHAHIHAASGLFSWSMELLASASSQLTPKIMDLSVRVVFFSFFP